MRYARVPVIVTALVVLAACGGGQSNQAQNTEPIQVGFIGTSTGVFAPQGADSVGRLAGEVYRKHFAGLRGLRRCRDLFLLGRLLDAARNPQRGEVLSYLLFVREFFDAMMERVADVALGAVSITHSTQASVGVMTLTADDSTGSGAGWKVTEQVSAFVYTGSNGGAKW